MKLIGAQKVLPIASMSGIFMLYCYTIKNHPHEGKYMYNMRGSSWIPWLIDGSYEFLLLQK